MKRIAAFLLAIAIVLSATPFVFAETTSEDPTTTVSGIKIYCETDYETVASGQKYVIKLKVSNPSQVSAAISCKLSFEGMKIVTVGDGDAQIDPDAGTISITTSQDSCTLMNVQVDDNAEGEVTANLTNIRINETPVEDYSLTIPVVEFAAEESGGEKYAYLSDAIADAAQGTGKVKLLRDVELTEQLEIPAGKKITLDLNGYTITGKPEAAGVFAVIKNMGNLTITGEGSVVCDYPHAGSTAYAVNTILNAGTLVIDGPTIENKTTSGSNQIGYGIDNNSTSANVAATIKSGEVKASGSYYYDGIRMFCNSESNTNSVTVEGGTVSTVWMQNPSDGTDVKDTKDVVGSVSITGGTVNSLYLEPSAKFTASITGGTVGSVSYFARSEGRDLTGFITGGTFGSDPDDYVADGYTITDLGNGQYMVTEMSAYAKFMDAIDKAQAGDTITLTSDITLYAEGVTITKDLTIDLNGKNITSEGDIFVVTGGTLTVNGSGEITANTDGTGTANAVWADGGKVIINGGTYSVGGDSTTTDLTHQNDLIYTKNSGTVTINGGTFLYTENVWTLNENDSNRGTITVKGGTFQNWNPANNVSEGEGTNFLAEGYKVTYASGKYTVSAWTTEEKAPEMDTTVSAGASTGKVEITDSNVTVDKVQQAANNTETKSDLADAAFNLQNDAEVVGTTSEAQNALTSNNVTIDNDTEITVQVEPYLDVQVKAADTAGTNKTMTVEIDAYYNVVAVATKNDTTVGTATLKEKQELAVSEPITITIPLPADFVSSTSENVYIHHYKDNGDRHTYVATVTGDANNGFFATFVNPNGFSTFEVSKSNQPSVPEPIEVKYNLDLQSYMDFSFFIDQDDLAKDESLIITIKQGSKEAITVTNWDTKEGYWRFRYEDVAPAEYEDALTLTIKDSQGNTIVEDTTTVKAYVELRISRNESDKALMEALLAYCGAAKTYFSQRQVSNSSSSSVPEPLDVKYNLDLQSYMDFSFFIDQDDLAKDESLIITIKQGNKEAVTVTDWDTKEGYWRFRYENVAPAEYEDALTLTIKDGQNTIVEDTTTVKAYAELRISRNESDKALMEALLTYCGAAKTYFSQQ